MHHHEQELAEEYNSDDSEDVDESSFYTVPLERVDSDVQPTPSLSSDSNTSSINQNFHQHKSQPFLTRVCVCLRTCMFSWVPSIRNRNRKFITYEDTRQYSVPATRSASIQQVSDHCIYWKHSPIKEERQACESVASLIWSNNNNNDEEEEEDVEEEPASTLPSKCEIPSRPVTAKLESYQPTQLEPGPEKEMEPQHPQFLPPPPVQVQIPVTPVANSPPPPATVAQVIWWKPPLPPSAMYRLEELNPKPRSIDNTCVPMLDHSQDVLMCRNWCDLFGQNAKSTDAPPMIEATNLPSCDSGNHNQIQCTLTPSVLPLRSQSDTSISKDTSTKYEATSTSPPHSSQKNHVCDVHANRTELAKEEKKTGCNVVEMKAIFDTHTTAMEGICLSAHDPRISNLPYSAPVSLQSQPMPLWKSPKQISLSYYVEDEDSIDFVQGQDISFEGEGETLISQPALVPIETESLPDCNIIPESFKLPSMPATPASQTISPEVPEKCQHVNEEIMRTHETKNGSCNESNDVAMKLIRTSKPNDTIQQTLDFGIHNRPSSAPIGLQSLTDIRSDIPSLSTSHVQPIYIDAIDEYCSVYEREVSEVDADGFSNVSSKTSYGTCSINQEFCHEKRVDDECTFSRSPSSKSVNNNTLFKSKQKNYESPADDYDVEHEYEDHHNNQHYQQVPCRHNSKSKTEAITLWNQKNQQQKLRKKMKTPIRSSSGIKKKKLVLRKILSKPTQDQSQEIFNYPLVKQESWTSAPEKSQTFLVSEDGERRKPARIPKIFNPRPSSPKRYACYSQSDVVTNKKRPTDTMNDILQTIHQVSWANAEGFCSQIKYVFRLAPSILKQYIPVLVEILLKKIAVQQSRVSGPAIKILRRLYNTAPRLMDQVCDIVICGMLDKLGGPLFIDIECIEIARIVTTNSNPIRTCLAFTKHGANHRMSISRSTTARFLCESMLMLNLNKAVGDETISQRRLTSALFEAGTSFLHDSSVETRDYGREMLRLLLGHHNFWRLYFKFVHHDLKQRVNHTLDEIRDIS